MMITGKNIIGFERSANGTSMFQAISPVTGKKLDTIFHEATIEEIDQAVSKAIEAFAEFSELDFTLRAQFLESIGEEILGLGDNLITICMKETGLPESRLKGERGRTVNQLNLFASLLKEGSWIEARIDQGDLLRSPIPKPDIRQMQVALGPVAIFGASNFPLAFSVAGGDTASALAAGCPAIVKAHPLHPGTSELIGQAIYSAAQKCGMPDGVFSLVHGISNEVGMTLVKHQGIKAIGFTGSFKGGKAIFDIANKRDEPIPVFAEMGSVNPVFILPGASKERPDDIAQGLHKSLTMGVGQFCTNPGLVITDGPVENNRVILKLGKLSQASTPGIMLSENIKNNYQKGIEAITEIHGLQLIASGNLTEGYTGVETNVFSTDKNTLLQHEILSHEIFGPATINISTRNKAEMMEIAENLDGHLTATIIGNNDELVKYKELIAILKHKVGRLIFNGYPTGVEVCHAMVHGGPFPATTCSQSTSVGTKAITRFTRPVCFQDFPDNMLPKPIQNMNSMRIMRMVNGDLNRKSIK